MAELKEVSAEIITKLSDKTKKQKRKDFMQILADVFLAKATTAEKIQKVQNLAKDDIDSIIRNLDIINSHIDLSAKEYFSDPKIERARRIVKEELDLFIEIKNELFYPTKLLPIGIIDMATVKAKLQLDKIVSIISRLNVLVGNVSHRRFESEDDALDDLGKLAIAA